VLTGSYHNYFRIYDVNESGDKDAVLQADKSAFKAKKIGGPKGQGKGPNSMGKKEGLQTENIDFAKKIVRSQSGHSCTLAGKGSVLTACVPDHLFSCMEAGIREKTLLL
jgi:serine/threonine-protein phosphatase 2A regulatory subunit B